MGVNTEACSYALFHLHPDICNARKPQLHVHAFSSIRLYERLMLSASCSGVAITTREAVIPDFARELERPGFGSKEQQKKVKGKGKAK